MALPDVPHHRHRQARRLPLDLLATAVDALYVLREVLLTDKTLATLRAANRRISVRLQQRLVVVRRLAVPQGIDPAGRVDAGGARRARQRQCYFPKVHALPSCRPTSRFLEAQLGLD